MNNIKEFDSVRELGQWLRDTPRANNAGNASIDLSDPEWYGNVSWDEALNDYALCGGLWREGSAKMARMQVETDAIATPRPAPALDLSVTGFMVDVDEYLTGNPECFIDEEEHETHSAPVIRLAVSTSRSQSVTAESSLMYGAAILSLIDAIEEAGTRVELHAVCDNRVRRGSRHDHVYVATCIKQAHDHWSPDSVAFSMAHPAFHRRLCFGAMERLNGITNGDSYGAGSRHLAANDLCDVYFPRIDSPDWVNTAEKAFGYVNKVYSAAIGARNE